MNFDETSPAYESGGASVSHAAPIKRAGMLIYGRDKDKDGYDRLFVLSSYTKGRYDANTVAYGLPKGSVDEGEKVKDAAYREGEEETGINPKKLLKGRYEGVKVKHEHKPIEATYISGQDAKRGIRLYVIELEDGCINKLAPHLKGERKVIKAGQFVPEREAVRLRDLPNFEAMMNVFRTGRMPKIGKAPSEQVLADPQLPKCEKQICEKVGLSYPIKTREDWAQFLEHTTKPEYRGFKRDFSDVAAHLHKLNLAADSAAVKFDEKAYPGQFYREGGAIIPLGTLLNEAAKFGEKNRLYACEVWGANRHNHAEIRLPQAQFATMLDYFGPTAPMEIADAAITVNGRRPALKSENESAPLQRIGHQALAYAEGRHANAWTKRVDKSVESKQTQVRG